MASALIACVLSVFVAGVAADVCNYQLYPDERERTTYCSYGCCYTLIYPCCIEPFYVSAAFIAPVVIGSVGLFIGLVVIIVVIVIRRKRMQTAGAVQYPTPGMQQQVVTTNGGVISYPGYGNTQYGVHPMYPGQPTNGTAPMYTVQGGPMYFNHASSGPPPTYTSQNVVGSAPGYVPQTSAPGYGTQTSAPGYGTQTSAPGYGTQTSAPGYATQTPGQSFPDGGADPVPAKTALQ